MPRMNPVANHRVLGLLLAGVLLAWLVLLLVTPVLVAGLMMTLMYIG